MSDIATNGSISSSSSVSSPATELELNVRMIWSARSILLAASNPSEILYARVLWRAAELRYALYQITIGDVSVKKEDPILKATIRAAQQLCEKLVKDTRIAAAPPGIYATETDTLVITLDKLSRQLCGILFETDPGQQLPLRQSTVKDWYIKLTFILTTLRQPCVTMKMTTLGFPDVNSAARYEQFKETQLLASLTIVRVKPEQNQELVRVESVGELLAGRRKETKLDNNCTPVEEEPTHVEQEKNDLPLLETSDDNLTLPSLPLTKSANPVPPAPKLSYAAIVKKGL